MNYENLLVEDQEGILVVTINRAEALNALNDKTIGELRTVFFEDAPNREGLKGVIITGAGDKAFIAGADIKEFIGNDEMEEKSRSGSAVFNAMEQFPKPVIAAVNGFCLGGGCELAMACHMRVASENARFGQPEVNLGIIPGYGGTQRLVQLIGKGRALELLLTGDMINAEDALTLGLANHVVLQGEEVTKAKEIINKIAKKGPLAVAKVIEAVNAYFDKEDDGFELEMKGFGSISKTEDFKEGAAAFIEKRKAEFTGK